MSPFCFCPAEGNRLTEGGDAHGDSGRKSSRGCCCVLETAAIGRPRAEPVQARPHYSASRHSEKLFAFHLFIYLFIWDPFPHTHPPLPRFPDARPGRGKPKCAPDIGKAILLADAVVIKRLLSGLSAGAKARREPARPGVDARKDRGNVFGLYQQGWERGERGGPRISIRAGIDLGHSALGIFETSLLQKSIWCKCPCPSLNEISLSPNAGSISSESGVIYSSFSVISFLRSLAPASSFFSRVKHVVSCVLTLEKQASSVQPGTGHAGNGTAWRASVWEYPAGPGFRSRPISSLCLLLAAACDVRYGAAHRAGAAAVLIRLLYILEQDFSRMSSKELTVGQSSQYVGPYRLEKTLGKGQTGRSLELIPESGIMIQL